MTVYELYKKLCEEYPCELSCEWDNDGIMCCDDREREVKSVLLCLDVTEEAVEYARVSGCDLIVSHHPLVFRGLRAVTEENHVARKAIKLLSDGISVFSFHTRADAAEYGVNYALAKMLGLENAEPFGDGMGRVGYIKEKTEIEKFAQFVKEKLSSPAVSYIGDGECYRVAVLGGDGKDCISDAIRAGADTYVSGSISYNAYIDAKEMGINVIEAGHFHTENPVLLQFEEAIKKQIPDVKTVKYDSYPIKHV